MTLGIEGKIVVITGASSGLGAEAARHLAAQGATLVFAARRADRIDALAREISSLHDNKPLSIVTDVSNRDSVQNMVDLAIAAYGRVDVLINNAGIMPVSPLERLKVEDWDRMIDVNVKGVLYGIASVLPHMQQQRSGHIINVSSMAGHRVLLGTAVYSATKFAVRAITEGLRQEVKPYDIRTTVISPGAISTEILSGITEPDVAESLRAAVSSTAMSPSAFARAVAFAIGQPDDVDINEIILRPTKQFA